MITLGVSKYEVDISRPLDISIPVRFDSKQLSVFDAPPSTSKPFVEADFIGSVSQGGSCNCSINTLIPHTAGTHTECVGHIADAPISIHEVLRDSLCPATLVSIQPAKALGCAENYPFSPDPGDFLLTRKSLEASLDLSKKCFFDALVIRTLPNPAEKQIRDYAVTAAPFLSSDAMKFILELGVQHLLVDLPSIDRLHDSGRLTNHRLFWNVAAGSYEVDKKTASSKTITELIYVPDTISDGIYLLDLQVASFTADAAPSRPILYKVSEI